MRGLGYHSLTDFGEYRQSYPSTISQGPFAILVDGSPWVKRLRRRKRALRNLRQCLIDFTQGLVFLFITRPIQYPESLLFSHCHNPHGDLELICNLRMQNQRVPEKAIPEFVSPFVRSHFFWYLSINSRVESRLFITKSREIPIVPRLPIPGQIKVIIIRQLYYDSTSWLSRPIGDLEREIWKEVQGESLGPHRCVPHPSSLIVNFMCLQDVWQHVVPYSCLLLNFDQENRQK